MKQRSLVAAVVASCGCFPAAAMETDVTVDGLVAYSLSQYDGDSQGDDFDAESNGSNVALRAALAERGIKAFLNVELGFEPYNDGSNNSPDGDHLREFFGGVSGAYGELSFGRQSTFYKQSGRQVDPFYDTSIVGFDGRFANEGAGYGLSNLGNFFVDNALAYKSPSVFGFTASGSMYVNDGNADSASGTNDDHDYGAGLAYDNPDLGFAVGVEYLDINSINSPTAGPEANTVFGVNKPVQSEAIRLYAGYRLENLNLGLSLEEVDVEGEADARKYLMLSVSYELFDDLRLAASYGHLDDVVPNAAVNPDGINGDGYSLGAFYQIMKNLTGYVAARSVSLDAGDDTTTIAAGLAFNFEAKLY